MSDTVAYIKSLELPAAPRRGLEDATQPPAFNSVAQALTVGSQMAEFSSTVPQPIRAAVSNGLLLGQLAADKATAGNPDPRARFDAFGSVMQKIGWQSTLSELDEQTISDRNAALHEAIIPIVTARLRSGRRRHLNHSCRAQRSEIDGPDAPWITVFQQKSNKVSATNFGLSYVDAGEGAARH
jgi:hypothetical protein